jgi:hypothetical protein
MRMACSYALEVWDRYALAGEPVVYTDGVVGMRHVVDMTLPNRAIAAVDRRLAGDVVDPEPIWEAYKEPISALQDDDLDFPTPIARAYHAIYNLFGVVFERTTLYDAGEIVVQQADTGPGFWDEWWTRTWDAWASRDIAYPPPALDAQTFDAIASGDLARAIELAAPRVREALATLAGDPIPASDALAVGGPYYAAFLHNRYVVRDRVDNRLRLSGSCGMTIRRVTFAGRLVIFAGDLVDDIGPYTTALLGEELDSRDYGYRKEYPGARRIAAVGTKTEIVPASTHEVGVLSADGYQRLDDGAVEGAALSDELLATFAGSRITLYERQHRRKLRELDVGATVLDVAFANEDLVVVLRGAPVRRISTAGL